MSYPGCWRSHLEGALCLSLRHRSRGALPDDEAPLRGVFYFHQKEGLSLMISYSVKLQP